MFDKKLCSFCPDTAVIWIWLDDGQGEQVHMCPRHHTNLMAMLLDLEDVQCPECGAAIHVEEEPETEPEEPTAPDEAQTQFDL